MNPFKYGQVVSAGDFCPRPDLMKQVVESIKAGQNIVLQGERRTGKTSLVHEAVRQLKKRRMLYIDLLEIKDADDLCKRMVKAIISLEQQSGFLDGVLRALAHLRPTVSVDPLTGEPSISLDASVSLKPDSVDGILDLVEKMQKQSPLVVMFDEFQDILNLESSRETLALLRSKIQFHNSIPYVFAGSVRNQMHDIFTNPDSPFFKSAISVEVGSLNREQFKAFLRTKFSIEKRTVDDEVLDTGFEIAGDLPGDVQQYCGALWDTTPEKSRIDKACIPPALHLIFTRESKGYEAVLVQLTAHQLRCLVGVAKLGGDAPFSGAFLQGVGIPNAASVKKALHRLVQLKVIYRYAGEFKFVNPFFKAWLNWKNL
ncbi:MAG: AAA family ATPase [bacterium]